MDRELKVLFVEDQPLDVELAVRALKRTGLTIATCRVDTAEDYRRELHQFDPHVILSDFSMPAFDGLSALTIAQQIRPYTPFLFISGTIGEETAVEALKRGAVDYVLKTNLTRLGAAVERAVQEATERAARRAAEERLRQSEERFRLFMHHLPDAAFVKDAEGRYIFVNQALAAALGRTADAVIGRSDADLWPDGTAQQVMIRDREAMSQGGVHQSIETMPGPGGPRYWHTTKFRFEHGAQALLGGVAVDFTKQLQAEEALRQSTERFELAARATNDAIWDWDIAQDRVWRDESYQRLTRLTREEMERDPHFWSQRIHPLDRDRVTGALHVTLTSRDQFWSDEYRLIRADGSHAYLFDRGYIVRDADGKALRMIGATTDLTNRRQMEEALRLSQRAMEASANPIIVTSASSAGNPIVYVNPAFERVTGYAREEVIGRDCRFLQGEDCQQADLEKIRAAIEGEHDGHAVLRNYRKDGSLFWNELYITPVRDETGSEVTHFVGLQYDVTQARRYQEELEYQAHHDALTGLPNRVLLKDRLDQAMARAQRNARLMAVMFIDLDRFKIVNDTLGHRTGDLLLQEASNRLAECIRQGDTVGRLGGDEFAIFLCDLGDAQDATLVAQKVMESLRNPFRLDRQEIFITASIGITIYPSDSADGDTLLRSADTAMFRAKELGRNNHQFYTASMNALALERLLLETDLRRALDRSEFTLYYQPKVNMQSGTVTGLEALLRWRHPEKGLIPPAEFIPVLEETGLINAVGEWVLRSVCMQINAWRDAGTPSPTVAINVAARQLHQRGFLQTVEQIIKESRMIAGLIEFEITESSLMSNPVEAAAILRGCRALGIRIAVDDFGTGYSSLSYLKRFPVDTVKIDRSFVDEVTTSPDDASIARAIITMGHSLKLNVVAEGVESRGQAVFLLTNRCDELQGYFFSKPLPVDEITTLLRDGRRMENITESKDNQTRTLLLVDDEPNILSALKRLLRRDGYRILTAGSAREGLELLSTNRVGVVVSDQRMPSMTGVEFLRKVKDLYPDTLRIVLSGYTDLQSVTDSINEGAIYKFLTKPWEEEQLRANIEEAFRHHELASENERLTEEVRETNAELQRLLRDRVEQAERGQIHLGIAQEVLQAIPLPVLGVDADGMIAVANSRAEAVFASGPLVGTFAQDTLPAAVLECLEREPACGSHVELDAARFAVLRTTMGASSRSQGTLVVMLPEPVDRV